MLDAKPTEIKATLDAVLIAPTVGRQVWYYPGSDDSIKGTDGAPLAATIARVWSDRCVNLQVIDSNGISWGRTSVTLMHGHESYTPVGNYCEWMPFQKGQARAQAAEKAVDGNCATAGGAVALTGTAADWHRQALEMAAASALANQVANAPHQAAVLATAMKLAIDTLLGVPVVETKAYPDGTTATGVAPLPSTSPANTGTGLLYELIEVAMDAIGEPPSDAAQRDDYPASLVAAYDALFRAFWSDCPIPARVTYRPKTPPSGNSFAALSHAINRDWADAAQSVARHPTPSEGVAPSDTQAAA